MLHTKIPSTCNLIMILVINSNATDLVRCSRNTDSAYLFVCGNLRINNRMDRLFYLVLFSPNCFHFTDKWAFILPIYVRESMVKKYLRLIFVYKGNRVSLPVEIFEVWAFSCVYFLVKSSQDIRQRFIYDPVHIIGNFSSFFTGIDAELVKEHVGAFLTNIC